MRIFLNEQRLKRNRQMATIMFFASLVILLGGLLVSYTVTNSDPNLMVIPLIAMPIGLFTTWWSVRLTNQYVRKPHAEDVMQAAFKGVSAHSVAYHYLFKANHVLICQQGVYSFLTRFQDGVFRVQGDRVTNLRARGPIGGLLTVMRQEQIGKPIAEAQLSAAELQEVLDDALKETPGGAPINVVVQPVVVFLSEKARLDIQAPPPIPVVLAQPNKDRKDQPSLKALFKEDRKHTEDALTAAEVNAIERALNTRLMIQTPQTAQVADA